MEERTDWLKMDWRSSFEWLFDCLILKLSDSRTVELSDCLTARLTDCPLSDCPTVWLSYCPTIGMTNWLANLQTDWLTYWLTDWLTDWSTDLLRVTGWLTDWRTGLLAHWLTSKTQLESTVGKKMAAVHFTTMPCETNTVYKVQRKPNFYIIFSLHRGHWIA